jgi:hypothetical protein
MRVSESWDAGARPGSIEQQLSRPRFELPEEMLEGHSFSNVEFVSEMAC